MGLFSKKLNPKDFAYNSVLTFKSQQRDDFSDDSFTFRHANIVITLAMAQNWFGNNLVDVNQAFKGTNLKVSQLPDWSQEMKVNKTLLDTEKTFDGCERVAWSKSKIGPKFKEMLLRTGATTGLMPCPQDLSIDVETGTWKLCDGTPFAQVGEVWRNKKTGKEFVYWHFDALVRSRMSLRPSGVDASEKYFMPYLFQSAGYLSETMFPGVGIVMGTREKQFGVQKQSQIPVLTFHTEENHRVFSVISSREGFSAAYIWSPSTTRYGYIFSDEHMSEAMDAALITVLDALPKVGDILADGYCNWPPGSDLDFQASCLSDISIFDDSNTADFHRGIIIPGPLYSQLEIRTMEVYDASSRAFHEALSKNDAEALDVLLPALHNIIALGTGAIVSHAANTFFYSVYNNQSAFPVLTGETLEEWLAYSENLLRYVALQDVDSQNANALSNLATLLSDRGDYKSALKCIDDGLEILADRDDTKPVSLAWQPGYQANLPIELELYISKASIFMDQDKPEKARELAEKVLRIANENDFDSGEVLAAKYMLENI
jgi:hypothetical protein